MFQKRFGDGRKEKTFCIGTCKLPCTSSENEQDESANISFSMECKFASASKISMAVDSDSEISSDSSESDEQLDQLLSRFDKLQFRVQEEPNSATPRSPLVPDKESKAVEDTEDGIEETSLKIARRKLRRQKKLILLLKEEHAYILARLQDEFERKLENLSKLQQDIFAKHQAKKEEHILNLERQLDEKELELKSHQVISTRLSSEHSKTLEELEHARNDCSESKAYILKLEARLREFHVPLPLASRPSDGESFQLLSQFRRRSGSN